MKVENKILLLACPLGSDIEASDNLRLELNNLQSDSG
jgi:hypothetical protein